MVEPGFLPKVISPSLWTRQLKVGTIWIAWELFVCWTKYSSVTVWWHLSRDCCPVWQRSCSRPIIRLSSPYHDMPFHRECFSLMGIMVRCITPRYLCCSYLGITVCLFQVLQDHTSCLLMVQVQWPSRFFMTLKGWNSILIKNVLIRHQYIDAWSMYGSINTR